MYIMAAYYRIFYSFQERNVVLRIQAKEMRGERKDKLWECVPLAGAWSLFLDVTNVCNFKCVYCPTGNPDMLKAANRGLGHMSMELFEKIVTDLKEMPRLKILGLYKDGEPLIHPRYTDMVRKLKAADVSDQIWAKTNGEFIGNHPDLATCGLDLLGISVPHVTEEGIFKTVGRRIDYDKYVENVRKLFYSKRTFKLYVKMGDVGLTDAEREKFYHDFEKISDLCSIEGLHGWSATDVKDIQVNNIGTCDGTPFIPKVVCPLPFYMMSINFNGVVSACNDDWASYHQLGNVNDNSIKEIWNGEKYKAFRLMHLDGRRSENRACANCQYIESLPDNIDQYAEEMRKRIYGS